MCLTLDFSLHGSDAYQLSVIIRRKADHVKPMARGSGAGSRIYRPTLKRPSSDHLGRSKRSLPEGVTKGNKTYNGETTKNIKWLNFKVKSVLNSSNPLNTKRFLNSNTFNGLNEDKPINIQDLAQRVENEFPKNDQEFGRFSRFMVRQRRLQTMMIDRKRFKRQSFHMMNQGRTRRRTRVPYKTMIEYNDDEFVILTVQGPHGSGVVRKSVNFTAHHSFEVSSDTYLLTERKYWVR